jgi:hypothetical protein
MGFLRAIASYTYSKSYDQTSSIQEQVDPYDYHRLDGMSAFDLKHNFVVSYNYDLPAENLAVTFMLLPHYAGGTSPAQLGALGSFLTISLNAAKRASTPRSSARSAFVRKAKAPSPAT